MSHLIAFYSERLTDSEGRMFREILQWDDEALEEEHDYIQWLFPLTEPSRFNPDCPILTQDDISVFRKDKTLKHNLLLAFERILKFYGFRYI